LLLDPKQNGGLGPQAPAGSGQSPGLPCTFVVHADWSVRAKKRWMCVAQPQADGWRIDLPEPVGEPETLLARLRVRAGGGAAAFGIDCPLGVPRAFACQHPEYAGFVDFLRAMAERPGFFQVADELGEVSLRAPFYPGRGVAGMTRLGHAKALGLADARALCRACDRATAERPAGAPVFWTLGANQSGKAALSAWRDMLIPALHSATPPRLWPFDGPFLSLLTPGAVAIAETYPAEAMRHLSLRVAGSKRRQGDRAAYAADIMGAARRLGATVTPDLAAGLGDGFGGADNAEDRFDCMLGVMCVLGVVTGARPDTAPDDVWIRTWEGWVLGQTALPAA
jgi:hypothetical protein